MPPPGGPQGGPPPGPPGQGAPPGAGQSQSGGGVAALMMNVDKAIDHIAQVIASSPAASPQEKQLIQVVDQAYGKLMESISGGTGADDQDSDAGGAQGQTTAPEAGGNKGAIPSPM